MVNNDRIIVHYTTDVHEDGNMLKAYQESNEILLYNLIILK